MQDSLSLSVPSSRFTHTRDINATARPSSRAMLRNIVGTYSVLCSMFVSLFFFIVFPHSSFFLPVAAALCHILIQWHEV